MGIPVKIYGKDFSQVDVTLIETVNEKSRKASAASGCWIDFAKDEFLSKATDDQKKLLAKRIVEVFLSQIERNADEQYKQFVIQDENKQKKKKDDELHFLSGYKGKLWYSNIVGILQQKDWEGKNLINFSPYDPKDKVLSDPNEGEGEPEAPSDYSESKTTDDAKGNILTWNNDGEFEKNASKPQYDITILIGSRFDNERPLFLSAMLSYETDYAFQELSVPSSDEELFEFLLLYRFRQQLLDAYENGLYKAYTRFEDNSPRLKGTIDIARHIKLNTGLNNGNIAYSYRENTTDNPLNHLIILTYQYANKRFPTFMNSLCNSDASFSKAISELRIYAPSSENTDISKTVNRCQKPVSHPLHYRYELLRKTCLMILQHIGISLFDTTDEDVQGILFYVPDLWELFLEKQFKGIIEMESQKEISGYKDQKTYPDFVLQSDSKAVMILDAKYRPVWGEIYKNKWDKRAADDYNKCLRDMVTSGVHATGVIFPMSEAEKDGELPIPKAERYKDELVRGYTSAVNTYDHFYTIPVFVPKEQDGEEAKWYKEFEGSIKQSLGSLKDCIKEEAKRSGDLTDTLDNIKDKISEGEYKILESLICHKENIKTEE